MPETDISQWIATVIAQVSTSSLSFLASTSIAVMIARKTPSGGGGLSTPYRRIIFGISISDIFQSFALATGPWSPPPDETHALWGKGNSFTCTINGVMLTLGMSPVPMYVCCLCIYYLCKLKLQMTNEAFTQRYEWKMHASIIVFNTVLVITALSMDTIHTTVLGTFCHFAALPTGCRQEPDLVGECDVDLAFRVQNLLLVNSVLVPFFSLVGIVTTMIMLFRNVLQRERIFQASYGSGHTTRSEPTSNPNANGNTNDRLVASSRNIPTNVPTHSITNECEHGETEDPLITIQQTAEIQSQDIGTQEQERINEKKMEAESLARLYRNETMLQAFLYVGAFCASFFPTWIYIVLLLMGNSNYSNIAILVSVCYPIQGLLNIFVYTRPFVTSLRRKHPEYSRLYAFYLIFAAGGEVPNTTIQTEQMNRAEGRSNGMLSLQDIDDPYFSLPQDFASIATPSFAAVSTSNLPNDLSMKDSNQDPMSISRSKYDNDSKPSPPISTRRFYKWPFSSKESGDSIWCSVSATGKGRKGLWSKSPPALGSSYINQRSFNETNNNDSGLGVGDFDLNMIDNSSTRSRSFNDTSSIANFRSTRLSSVKEPYP